MHYGVSFPDLHRGPSPRVSRMSSHYRNSYWAKTPLQGLFARKRKRQMVYPRRTYYSGKLKRILQQEIPVGFNDTSLVSQTFDTTTGIFLLNGLQRGTSATTRTDYNIQMFSLQIRFFVVNNSAALTNSCRVCIVYDRQPAKAAPTQNLIFAATESTSFPRMENNKRFKIIRSWYFVLTGSDATSGGSGKRSYVQEAFIKFPKALRTRYDSNTNTGNIDEIIEGSLYLIYFSDQAASATLACRISCKTRLRFTG